MVTEQWRPVPGFEGYYEISDLGRVWSVGRWARHPFSGYRWVKSAPRKPGVGQGGYLLVTLHLDGHRSTHYVAILVLRAFVGERPGPGYDACHDNGVRTDNRLSNLRWDTKSKNQHDSVRHGTHRMTRIDHCPRGHPLSGDNLEVFSGKKGRPTRRCKACRRAHVTVQQKARRGIIVDFEAESHRRYEEIKSGVQPSRGRRDNDARCPKRCPAGHLLESPNLIPSSLPHRKCLACSRAQGDAQVRRRYGRPVPVDLADRKYAAIMSADLDRHLVMCDKMTE